MVPGGGGEERGERGEEVEEGKERPGGVARELGEGVWGLTMQSLRAKEGRSRGEKEKERGKGEGGREGGRGREKGKGNVFLVCVFVSLYVCPSFVSFFVSFFGVDGVDGRALFQKKKKKKKKKPSILPLLFNCCISCCPLNFFNVPVFSLGCCGCCGCCGWRIKD